MMIDQSNPVIKWFGKFELSFENHQRRETLNEKKGIQLCRFETSLNIILWTLSLIEIYSWTFNLPFSCWSRISGKGAHDLCVEFKLIWPFSRKSKKCIKPVFLSSISYNIHMAYSPDVKVTQVYNVFGVFERICGNLIHYGVLTYSARCSSSFRCRNAPEKQFWIQVAIKLNYVGSIEGDIVPT